MRLLHHALVGTLPPAKPTPAGAARPTQLVMPLGGSLARRGDWHYAGCSSAPGSLFVGLFVSLALHVVFLYGFNVRPAPKITRAADVELIQIAMPELEPEETDPVEALSSDEPETPAVNVPMLADVPSAVAVSAFVQPIQFRPEVSADLNAANLRTIPVSATRGHGLPAGMGKIFELSQLDRHPVPIMQPAPVFPLGLRHEVEQATVMVGFIVDTNGEVVAPYIVSSTHRGFEAAAVAGVLKWKFRPGMKSGRRVNSRVAVPINFRVTSEQ